MSWWRLFRAGAPSGASVTAPPVVTPPTAGSYVSGPVTESFPTVDSAVVPLPAGAAANDWCLLVATWNKAATTITGHRTGATDQTWLKGSADQSAASNHGAGLLYRRLTAADITAGSVTLSLSTLVDRLVTSAFLIGNAPGEPRFDPPVVTTTLGAALVVPAHTTAATDSLLVAAAASRNATASSPAAITVPGWTEAGESSTASSTANTWSTWIGHRTGGPAGSPIPEASGSTASNSIEAVWLVEFPPGTGTGGSVDGGTTGGLPLLETQMAHPVANFMGVCLKPNLVINPESAVTVLDFLGFLHTRISRIGAPGPGAQRNLANAIGTLGTVDVIANIDDVGAPTPAQRIVEFMGWRVPKRAIGGANEPQQNWMPDTWPEHVTGEPARTDIPANNTRTTNDLSWGETQRQTRKLRADLNAYLAANPGAPPVPIIAPSFSVRSRKGWFAKLALGGKLFGVAGQPDVVQYGDVHNYQGGLDPSKDTVPAVSQRTYIEESRDLVNDAPVLITETGTHDDPKAGLPHQHTPRLVAGLYAARGVFKLMDIPRCAGAYIYEAADDPDPQIVDRSWEEHFGLFTSVVTARDAAGKPTAARLGVPKPAAVAYASVTHLHSDPGPDFTPHPIGFRVETAVPNLQIRGKTKRDGTQIVTLWRDVEVGTRGGGTTNTYELAIPADIETVCSVEPGRTIYRVRHIDGLDSRTPVTRRADGTIVIPLGADATSLEVAP